MRFCLAYALYPGISSMQTEEVTNNGTLKWELAYKSISYQYLVTCRKVKVISIYFSKTSVKVLYTHTISFLR